MAHTASLHLSHLPPTTSILTSLFTHVANAAYIRSQLLASNPDYDYAFIDASSILSTTHVLAAVERAVRDWSRGRGKSRNVHSEVVFCLGGSNNISDALRRFGITDKTTSLLAIRILDTTASSQPHHHTLESIQRFLSEAIEGTSAPFSDEEVAKVRDIPAIRKSYKLPAPATIGGGKKGGKAVQTNGSAGDEKAPEENERTEMKELEMNVLGIMAIKGS